MLRRSVIALCSLTAGCASDAVTTSEQARTIALASPCAKAPVVLDPGETMPAEWLAEKRGDRWYAWLPSGPGSILPVARGHMGAWINARDGKVLYCERGGRQPQD